MPRLSRLKVVGPVWHNQAILTETEFVLDGRLGELNRLAAQTEAFCRANRLPNEIEFDLNLVLEELFVNAVKHGGCDGMERAVEVRLLALPHAIGVEFADRGRPFDPFTAPQPDLCAPLEDRSAGGLGLHLVRQIMRDLHYRRENGWNRITMRRESI